MINKLILILLLFIGCQDDYTFLDIHLGDNAIDDNGYHRIEYTGTTYHHVYYRTDPNQRVFWDSPDSFDVMWQGRIFTQPIINYSTYANEYGDGTQLFYLAEDNVGDTLMIYGYVDNLAHDYIYIIVE